MVRCFIGILIPDEIKDKISLIQKQIEKISMDCKLVEKENLHLSLSFLGDVEETKIEEISKVLDKICENYEKPDVTISEIKIIPNEKYIRVIALNVKSSGVLELIGKHIEKEIGGDVKPPHLTLCRVRNLGDKNAVLTGLKKINIGEFNFTVDSVCLIKSELQKPGPVYTVLHESKFR